MFSQKPREKEEDCTNIRLKDDPQAISIIERPRYLHFKYTEDKKTVLITDLEAKKQYMANAGEFYKNYTVYIENDVIGGICTEKKYPILAKKMERPFAVKGLKGEQYHGNKGDILIDEEGNKRIVDEETFKKEYGYPPDNEIEQYIYKGSIFPYLALFGNASQDNLDRLYANAKKRKPGLDNEKAEIKASIKSLDDAVNKVKELMDSYESIDVLPAKENRESLVNSYSKYLESLYKGLSSSEANEKAAEFIAYLQIEISVAYFW